VCCVVAWTSRKQRSIGLLSKSAVPPAALIGSSDLMGRAPGGRKLIAVVYADIGYSRLIGIDDIGTIERLRTLRTTLIDYAVNEHGRKIVQTGGDSLLIVFDSIDGCRALRS
jgi:class 3 adenylate cyclase